MLGFYQVSMLLTPLFIFFNLAFALLDEYIFLLSLIYSTNASSPQMRYCVILFNIGVVASFGEIRCL